ncbi:MAG: alpha/beta hydrolase [Lachnospiraceae bacterium]|nr:alpha/beta hydrolase [Lachnospiraceae bacterium]
MIKDDFTCKGHDGMTIRGKICRPEGEGRFPAVIFSHGFGSNYRQLIHHGDLIAEAGIVCVFFDFCGGGLESESDGTMQEMTLFTEKEDLINVMKAVRDLPYVDTDKFFLMGESQGGMVTAMVGAEFCEEVKGLILWYPAFVIPEDSARRIREGEKGVFGIPLSPDYDKTAVSVDVEKIQKAYEGPVLLLHGDKDPVVPADYSRRALDTYPNASLREFIGAGHGFEESDSTEACLSSIGFIRDIVKNR